MTGKPLLVMDQHFRRVDELFDQQSFNRLQEMCEIVGAVDSPMSRSQLESNLDQMQFLVAAHPTLDDADLARATKLQTIIEVSGTFQEGLNYQACFDRGIEVLSCAPGFKFAVSEMTVGMIIAGARGLIQQHEAFRTQSESWLSDERASDFSVYCQTIGFVGFGAIAKECSRLLAPFQPRIKAFDPWLTEDQTNGEVELCELDKLLESCRCIVVAASPTDENWQLIGRREIELMPDGALLVVISRSHLVDYAACVEAAETKRIRLAIDVFPQEPVPANDSIRSTENVILSPHRAAAVPGGRHPIGRMIAHDVEAVLNGKPERLLQPAEPHRIANILGAPGVRNEVDA